MDVAVYNMQGNEVAKIKIDEKALGGSVNAALLKQAYVRYHAHQRQGSAKTKNRHEVEGSTRKIYKQKGTGNARHGDRNAPNFVGGGQVHGPVPRSYAYRPTRKMRQGALTSALSLKVKEGALTIVDSFDLGEIKTKALAGVLAALKVDRGSLIVDAMANQNLRLSARNLSDHQVLPPEGVNIYDVLRHPHLVLTKSAAQALEARCKA